MTIFLGFALTSSTCGTMLHSSCYLGGHSHGVWLAYPCSYAQYESPSPVGEGRRGLAVWEEFVRTFFIDFVTLLHLPYALGS